MLCPLANQRNNTLVSGVVGCEFPPLRHILRRNTMMTLLTILCASFFIVLIGLLMLGSDKIIYKVSSTVLTIGLILFCVSGVSSLMLNVMAQTGARPVPAKHYKMGDDEGQIYPPNHKGNRYIEYDESTDTTIIEI